MKFKEQVVECRKLYFYLDGLDFANKQWIIEHNKNKFQENIELTMDFKVKLLEYNILARIWAKLTWRI